MAAGFLDHASGLTENITVEVIAFDNYVRDRKIDLDRVGLIKIDVEGFETEVFDGMQGVLAKSGRKVPILCEVLTDLDRPGRWTADGSSIALRGAATAASMPRICGRSIVMRLVLRRTFSASDISGKQRYWDRPLA